MSIDRAEIKIAGKPELPCNFSLSNSPFQDYLTASTAERFEAFKTLLRPKSLKLSFFAAGYWNAKRALPPRAPPLLYHPELKRWFKMVKNCRKAGAFLQFLVGSDMRGRLYFMPFSYASIIFLTI